MLCEHFLQYRDKLEPRAKRCVFWGIQLLRYKFYDPDAKKLNVSHDHFLESEYFFNDQLGPRGRISLN